MAHKCSEPGCFFYLPDEYPLDKCPWHLAPNSDVKTRLAFAGGAVCLLGAGYGISKGIAVWESRKKQQETAEAQEEWRNKSESRNRKDIDERPEDDLEDSASFRAGGEESA